MKIEGEGLRRENLFHGKRHWREFVENQEWDNSLVEEMIDGIS